MPKKSAGILPFRKKDNEYEIFLVHPGGPYWAKKDVHVWSVAKGEFEEEDALSAAKREFKEETGFTISGNFIELKPFKQSSGKIIYTWAIECDLNASAIKSNLFDLEWPPCSGQIKKFPEVDRAGWFSFEKAKEKIVKGQIPILEELEGMVKK